MHQTKRSQHAKTEAFELYLEFLRYALGNKKHFLRVIQNEPASFAEHEVSIARVMIEIDGIPFIEGKKGLPIPARIISEFFESWELQENLLRWLGRRIAGAIPRGVRGARLRKGFANLTGRMGKLPPRMVVRAQYDRLVWEIDRMQSTFQISAVPNDEQRAAILEFGRNTSAHWLPYVQGGLDLNEILLVPPGKGAELILGEQYGCTEENIRSWLSRRD